MPTIRCKEKIRNERRIRDRLKKRTGLLEKPMTRILDIPGEMIRETKKGNITEIKYCDKAHGGSPVTFIIKEKSDGRARRRADADEIASHRPWSLRNSIKVASAIRSANDIRD